MFDSFQKRFISQTKRLLKIDIQTKLINLGDCDI
jgi:hypothetical protein